MSVDLIELGQSIGEAQATADAALEVAEIAEAEATLAVAESAEDSPAEEATAHCGPDCPCHTHQRELEAMLVALSDKHDEDMDTIARALDYLLGEEVEESDGVEVINPEEAENGRESATDKSGAEGHGAAGAGDTEARESAEEEKEPHANERKHRSTASSRIRFRRGR